MYGFTCGGIVMCYETEKGPQQTDVTELKARLLSETLEVFCYVCA